MVLVDDNVDDEISVLVTDTVTVEDAVTVIVTVKGIVTSWMIG
jgi:hypothetical protein